MEKIISYERTTGMGARHGTQYLATDGQWYFVSESPDAFRTGRDSGFDIWALPSWEGCKVREFHRSNSGAVTTHEGLARRHP